MSIPDIPDMLVKIEKYFKLKDAATIIEHLMKLEEYPKIFFHNKCFIIAYDQDTHFLLYNEETIHVSSRNSLIKLIFGADNKLTNHNLAQMFSNTNFINYRNCFGIDLPPNTFHLNDLIFIDNKGNIRFINETPKLLPFKKEIYSLHSKKYIPSLLNIDERVNKEFLKYPKILKSMFSDPNSVFQFCCSYVAMYFLNIQPIKLFITSCGETNLKRVFDTFRFALNNLYSYDFVSYNTLIGASYYKPKCVILTNNKTMVGKLRKFKKYNKSSASFVIYSPDGEFDFIGDELNHITNSFALELQPNFRSFSKLGCSHSDEIEIRDYLIDCLLLLCFEYKLLVRPD